MEKVLNQEEIDAMVRAARGGGAGSSAGQTRSVVVWDPHKAGLLGREQMRAIRTLHDTFARNLTHSLGAYLRITFNAALVSAEHLSYRDFLQTIPEMTYLASSKLAPLGVSALLQLDLAVAFPLVDILLGGEGKGTPPARPITEIEEKILETVMRIICRELQVTWQALSLEFQFDQRQSPEQAQHLLPEEDKTLALSFEITLAESRGTLSLAMPAVASNALLRKLSAEWSNARPRLQHGLNHELRRRLMGCEFPVELSLTRVTVAARELLALEPGRILRLRHKLETAAALLVGGDEVFCAQVARRGPQRAAQLTGYHATEGKNL
jgi:flagellar motor switch protein FliM